MMFTFLISLLILVLVRSAPTEEDVKKTEDQQPHPNVNEQSRAGITDILNPLSGDKTQPTNKNKDDETNNPLENISNFLTNGLHSNLLNASSPLQQFTSGSQHFLDGTKMFLISTQGMVFPASSVFGGFQNVFQNIGNLGNLAQGAQHLLPLSGKQ